MGFISAYTSVCRADGTCCCSIHWDVGWRRPNTLPRDIFCSDNVLLVSLLFHFYFPPRFEPFIFSTAIRLTAYNPGEQRCHVVMADTLVQGHLSRDPTSPCEPPVAPQREHDWMAFD